MTRSTLGTHLIVSQRLKFIDVFAGCGGLSLGLMSAGCEGIFAVEKSALAFSTLKHNLTKNGKYNFNWPSWLPVEAMTCEDLINGYSNEIGKLLGQIDMIVGGPPCQGFSTAGKRDPADPRNKMTEQYLALVGLVKPKFLVIENVAGFNMKFETTTKVAKKKKPAKESYAQYIAKRLVESGYSVSSGLVNCADFGVPQNRHRFLIICERNDENNPSLPNLLESLKVSRDKFLTRKGLPIDVPTSVHDAISDLEIAGKTLIPCKDSNSRFKQIAYVPPEDPTPYQRLMCNNDRHTEPNSLRLPNHKPETLAYFKLIQKICRPGFCLSVTERELAGTKKFSTTVLRSTSPAPTVTTLPDDIVHYNEPRILTVRENARLQSFPDWFAFQSKYTTGGKQRKQECPRYTQVGNAVPPLLAEAIGEILNFRKSEGELQESLEKLNCKKPVRSFVVQST